MNIPAGRHELSMDIQKRRIVWAVYWRNPDGSSRMVAMGNLAKSTAGQTFVEVRAGSLEIPALRKKKPKKKKP